MTDNASHLTPMERRALDRMDAETERLRSMRDTTPAGTDHAAAIKDQAHKLAEGNIWAVDSYIAEIERHVDALQAERDYHRDDAAMVRRERDVAINRLARDLAEARKEIAYWKSCVEDPYLYWGRDEKPYGHLDDHGPDLDLDAPGDAT